MATANQLVLVYQTARRSLEEAVEGLAEETARYKPADHVASIAELLVHIGDSERRFLDLLGYDTPSPPTQTSLNEACAYLERMEECLCRAVRDARSEELTALVETGRQPISLAWTIKRVTQHMLYHLGTIVYLRRLCEPDWAGEAGGRGWGQAVDALSDLIPVE